MKLKSTMIALMIAALPGVALAQSTGTKSTPRIDQRQVDQEKRIEQGAKSGQLTDKEAGRLEKGQAHVQKMEDKAVADGKVTKKERKKIEHAQDQQSKKIHREKHDKQTAAK
ncbi:MAG TPA: hypothetical protein VKF40_07535 [Burkholderiales bacterium]|nr:hypothetical protein [Burkholderiales bacterium]